MFILEGGVGNYIYLKGKKYSYFAGNNYLGLANHPASKAEAISSIEKYGINCSASRETTGTSELHLKLEKRLSQFKDRQDAVVFASGYLGNKILLHALRDQYTAVFVDESAHPSILDGIPSDINKVLFYEHTNVNHLEILLNKNKKFKPLIITDGLFALSGEIAPLDQIHALAIKRDGIVVVDDAHATGVLGDNGRGTPEHFRLHDASHIFQSETMSKAIGAYGGFIAASSGLINRIRKNSLPYIGSTALPPPIVAAGCASVKIMMEHPKLRHKLFNKAQYIRDEVKTLNYSTSVDNTPIIPIFFNSEEKAQSLSHFLLANDIIAPNIKYPVKMEKYLVRMTVSALHTQDQIDKLLALLKKWRDEHGIN